MSGREPGEGFASGQEFIDWLTARIDAADAKSTQANGHATQRSSERSYSDDEVLQRCRRARNSEKFADLFDRGDVDTHHRGDDSAADFALVGILKKYTHDPDQLERLMRRSALSRAKWNEKRGGRSWLRYSIDNALASLASPPYIGSDASDAASDGLPLTLETFSGRPTPGPREFVVADLIPRYYPTTLFGWGGTAKSLIAALLAIRVAGKCPTFFGRELLVHGPTLFLDFELDGPEQHRRIAHLAKGMNLQIPKELLYVTALGRRTRTAVEFALAACQKHGVVLVIVDSLGPAMVGDMAAAKDVIAFHNNFIRPFQTIGVTVVLVDHQARQQPGEGYQAKGAFGSSYKEHLSRSLIQVERGDQSTDDGTLNVRLRHRKANFGMLVDPFDVTLTFSEDRILSDKRDLEASEKAQETTLTATERVISVLEDGPTYSDEIAEASGLKLGTVKNKITALKKAGRVATTGQAKGQYEQVRLASPASPLIKGGDAGDAGHDDNKPKTVADLFQDPPDWLSRQIKLCQEDPARHIGPLCTAVASTVLGDGMRADEVRDEVEQILRVLTGQDPLRSTTTVVNYRSGADYDVFCGRAADGTVPKTGRGMWGNPFKIGSEADGTREECIDKHARYLYGPVENYEGKVFDGRHLLPLIPTEIKGRVLGCTCKPQPCHCETLARIADEG